MKTLGEVKEASKKYTKGLVYRKNKLSEIKDFLNNYNFKKDRKLGDVTITKINKLVKEKGLNFSLYLSLKYSFNEKKSINFYSLDTTKNYFSNIEITQFYDCIESINDIIFQIDREIISLNNQINSSNTIFKNLSKHIKLRDKAFNIISEFKDLDYITRDLLLNGSYSSDFKIHW